VVSLQSATVIWDAGGGNGLWSTGTNWSANIEPLAVDDVQLPVGLGATITLSAGEFANTLLFQDSGYTLTGGGLTLTAGTITVDPGFSGTIATPLAGTVISKQGTGTLILSGANGYTGLTTVAAGVLNIQNNTALGTTAGATSVTSGAALEMQGGITVTGEALTLNGSGVGAAGALRNVSGNNSYNANITLGSAVRINSDAGTLTIDPAAGNAFAGAFALTLGGVGNITVNDPIATGAGTLTKDGTGTATLTGASSYTGITTISGGVLNVRNATALGTTAGGVTVAGGSALELQGGITIGAELITINGNGIGAGGAIRSVSGTNSYNTNITLASDARVNSDAGTLTINPTAGNAFAGAFNLTLGGAGNITVNDALAIGTGTLTKDGAGMLTLTAASTYTGLTAISGGVLRAQIATALGTNAAGTTVANGAALELQGTITIVGEALTLSGTGIGGTGALRNTLNSNSFNGNITLAANSRVNSDSGVLTISPVAGSAFAGAFDLTLGGAGSITVSRPITTGASAVTLDGAGTVIFNTNAANTYTGLTTISSGILSVRNATGLGTNATGTVVANGAQLQIRGTITVAGEALTISGTGGGTGALRSTINNNSYNGTITLAADSRINSDANTLTLNPTGADAITGGFNLTLGGAGAITVSRPITIGAGTLTKDGTGTVTINVNAANNYTGLTSVNAGALNVRNATGLGTSAAGTTVASGAALQIQGTITVTGESLTLNGTGIGGTGAFRNITNTNSFNGNITLGSDVLIVSNAGALTINPASGNSITGTNVNLSLGGNGAMTISKSIVLGTGALTKAGTGTVTLLEANTYDGLTAINAGAVNIRNDMSLGSVVAGTSVTTGAALQLQGGITVTGEALTLNGTGVTATGALRSISGNNNFNGNITLGSAVRINSDAGILTLNPAAGDSITGINQNLTLGGVGTIVVSKAITTGTGTLTKDGTGTATLLGSNTYTGLTTVSAGVLNIQNDTALGTSANGTSVTTGAALQMQGGITVTDEALTLNGTGVGGTGALRNISGDNNYNGNITLGAVTRVNSDIGTLTIDPGSGNAFSGAFNLTLGGVGNITVNDPIATGAGTLTKDGVGILTLAGPNTYTGLTTVSAGVLNIRNDTALGGTASGSSVTSGAALQMQGGITVTGEALTLNGTGVGATGALRNISGDNNFNGNITLGAATRINSDAGTLTIDPAAGNAFAGGFALTFGGAGNASVNDAIATGAGVVTKDGAGTLTLAGANTYTGLTTVSVGVLNIRNDTALGGTTSGTTVTGGAMMEIQGGITVMAEALTLNGSGVGAAGALRNISGDNSFNGNITLASVTRINSDAGTLTIDPAAGNAISGAFALTFGGAGNITVNDAVATGAGTVTKDGAGTLTFEGANTYTGLTTVSAGVLNIRSDTALGTAAAGTTVNLGAALEMEGGITVTGEALALSGNGIVGAGALRNISGDNNFNGNITLGAATRINSDAGTLIIDPASGDAISGAFDLTFGGAGNITVSDVIATGAGTVTKDGVGTLTFEGANTFMGLTTVSAGALNIRNDAALGTTAAGTVVSVGGTLEMQGGITVTDETLTLNGTGVGGAGALRNISGDNSFNTNITLAGATRINSDSGTLTINPASGDAISGTSNLTLGGDGNIEIQKALSLGTAALNKDGTGTATLFVANTYSGVTTISGGALNIRVSGGLGANTAGTVVGSGGALQLQGGVTVTAEALTLSGDGVSSDGALRNISGDNAYNGNITLNAASRIQSDAGTLTVNPSSGDAITGANHDLIVSGAGDVVISKSITTGTGGLVKEGAGTLQILEGNTYTGSTTLDGGTLQLVYGSNSSKLSDTAALILNSGTLDLAGSVGHNEVVASTSVNGTVTISRSAGSAVIHLNTITPGIGADLHFTEDNIATTDNLNDGSGILGSWATVGGLWATNSTNAADGLIIGYTGYIDVPRLGGEINDGPSNIRITDVGNTVGNVTLGGVGLTSINSLLQGAPGGTATVDIGVGNTLRISTGGILLSSGNGALVFGSDGVLTAGTADDTAGTLSLTNQDATNSITVNTVITNNGTGVVSLTKSNGTGTVVLTAANTYTGLTTVNSGTLAYGASDVIASGGVTVDGATAVLALGVNQSDTVGTVIVANGGSITGSGTSTMTSTGTYDVRSGSVSAILGGSGITLTKTTTGTVTLSGANTYTGLTTVSAGTLAYGASDVIASGGVTVDGATAVLAMGANQSDTVGTVILANGGSITGSGTSTLTSTGSFDVRSGSISAILGGSGITLTKTTAGTVTLSGANTYTGLTTVSAGTLAYGANNAIGSGDVTLDGGTAVLAMGANRSDTVGTVILANGGSITGSGTSTLTSTGSFDVRSGSISAILGGVGITLTKTTAGTVTLSGANTYTGLTTVSAGTLAYGANNAIGSGDVTVDGGTAVLAMGANRSDSVGTVILANGGSITGSGTSTLVSTGSFDVRSGSISAILDGVGITLTKTTAGTVTLSGANTYTGLTTVSAGTLAYGANNAIGSGDVTVSGATSVLNLGANRTDTVGTVTLLGGAVIDGSGTSSLGSITSFELQNGTVNVGLAGTADLNKTTAGTVTLNGTGAYSGDTTVSAGTLVYGASNVLGSGSLLVSGASTILNMGANNTDTVGLVTLAGGATIAGSGTSELTSSAGFELQNGVVNVALAGAVDLNKTTVGTVTLNHENTYSGLTTVSAGNLVYGANDVLGSGDVTVDGATAVLDMGSNQTDTVGTVTLSNGGTITGTGSSTLTSTGTFEMMDGSVNVSLDGAGIDFNKTTGGTVSLNRSNTFTGITTVTAGSLSLNNAAANNTTILGDGNTVTTGDIVVNGGSLVFFASEQIADTAHISMTSGSISFSGSGLTETIDGLSNSGGTLTTGANTIIGLGATVTWAGGTNTINNGGTVSDKHWVISGGTNTVNGGASGGTLRVQNGGGTNGFHFSGTASPTVTLDSSNSVAGRILLRQDVFVDADVTSGTAQILNGGAGANSGFIDMSGGTRTFDINDGSAATDLLISASIRNGAMIKDNAGTLELRGNNTFAGATTINDGRIIANGANTLGSTSGITVNAGGTLLLAGTGDRVGNSTDLILSGGALSLSGLSDAFERMDSLTLSADSIIDFGTGNSNELYFTSLDIGAFTLEIYGWSGAPYGPSETVDHDSMNVQDRLYFSTNPGLTPAQYEQIRFYNDGGVFIGTAHQVLFGADFEIVPVPEPGTVLGGVGLVLWIGWRERRRLVGLLKRGKALVQKDKTGISS